MVHCRFIKGSVRIAFVYYVVILHPDLGHDAYLQVNTRRRYGMDCSPHPASHSESHLQFLLRTRHAGDLAEVPL